MELSVHLHWLRTFTEGVTESTATWSPNEDPATVTQFVWHSDRCSLLLLSWQLLTTLYILDIWLGFQQVHILRLKFKPGTKELCGFPSVLKELKQQQRHEQSNYHTLADQKIWWGIERKGQEPCKKKVGETAAMRRLRDGKRKSGEILCWGKTEIKIFLRISEKN